MERHDERIEVLLDRMTLEEQVSLLAGADFWTTVPIERLGVPAIKVSDGPNGARGGGSLVGGVKAASFPVGIALAATWNPALIEQIGQALAEEARSKGARVLLAPTVNIHRSPLNGRNFECYSEDPFLAARIAVAYVTGLQRGGVAATIKHYVGNESEFERMTISSEIDERPLREIYLLPFEAAVKEAKVWAVMASYNKLNGTFASENPRLLTEILRQDWGFDGLLMSDWFGTRSTVEAANAGLDLEMPGPARHRGANLADAVRSGQVGQETVHESARRLLRLIARVGTFDDPTIPEEREIDRPEHRAIIRQAGAEGIVLLKNEGVLPLNAESLQRIAVIGPNAKTAQIMGGGSAQLNAHYRVTPFDGIRAQVGASVDVGYEIGCANAKLLPLLDRAAGFEGFDVEFFDNLQLAGQPILRRGQPGAEVMWLGEIGPGVDPRRFSARLSGRLVPTEGGDYRLSLVSAGRSRLLLDGKPVVDNWSAWKPGDNYFGAGSAEVVSAIDLQAGRTYNLTVEYSRLPDAAFGMAALRVGMARPLGDEAIERAVQLAARSDVALLFVGLTSDWDTEGRDRPNIDLPGRQDELIARVAAANPRTVVVLQSGAPVAMPWLADVAAVLEAWYPGQECGNAIADVLFGTADPAGRLPQTFPVRLEDNPAFLNYPGENGRVRYGEGIFIGYRYYDRKRVAPLFPFGHGLSYTTFDFRNLRLSTDHLAPGDELQVTLDVTNTGAHAGQEVVQLYVRDEEARLSRPPKELKGFAKVSLAPGETTTVTLPLTMRSLAYFDDARSAWVADAGRFEVLVGRSAADIRARTSFWLTSEWIGTR